MTTALQLVNQVLRRLRENEVTSFTAEYPRLVLDYINETKTEVENAWDWLALRTTKTVTTAAGTNQYALTGAGDRFRVIKTPDNRPAVFNTTDKYQLTQGQTGYMRSLAVLSSTQAPPMAYHFFGYDANGDPYVEFDHVPSGIYNIQFNLVIPQADLSATTDVLSVPSYPVMLGAYARAIRERGEDEGLQTNEAFLWYKQSLEDHIAREDGRVVNETNWVSV